MVRVPRCWLQLCTNICQICGYSNKLMFSFDQMTCRNIVWPLWKCEKSGFYGKSNNLEVKSPSSESSPLFPWFKKRCLQYRYNGTRLESLQASHVFTLWPPEMHPAVRTFGNKFVFVLYHVYVLYKIGRKMFSSYFELFAKNCKPFSKFAHLPRFRIIARGKLCTEFEASHICFS